MSTSARKKKKATKSSVKALRKVGVEVGTSGVSTVAGAFAGAKAESLVPGSGVFVGATIQSIVEKGFRYFYTRNPKRLVSELDRGLKELEEKAGKRHLNIEDLAKDQDFIRNMFDATQAAFRDGRDEKIKILRNALLNSIFTPPSTAKQQIFFQYIDQFTEWHIALLKFFENPKKTIQDSHGAKQCRNIEKATSFVRILGKIYPPLEKETETFLLQIWNTLSTAGMIAIGPDVDFLNNRSEQKLYERRLTTFGQEFLAFISEPR